MKKNIVLLISLFGIIIICGMVFNSSSQNNNANHRLQWWLDDIENVDLNKNNTVGSIKVAIIDSDVNIQHPDLNEDRIEVAEIISKDTINTNYSHGTMVAGIIAARPSDNKGLLGIAPEIDMICIDITDDKGRITVENLIHGIKIAIDNNVDIINMSLGIKSYSKGLQDIIEEAWDSGIILIAASGEGPELLYPAKFDEVISVGAFGKDKKLMFTGDRNMIDIYAPGENIVTINSTLSNHQKKYVSVDGSSFSTAMVTGAIARLKQYNSEIENNEIYEYLINNKKQTLKIRKLIEVFDL